MKSSHLLFYFSKLSIFAMCICFITLFARFFVPVEFLSENLPYYIVMFYLMTALCYVFLYKNMILEGVLSIQAGESPVLIERKLRSFILETDSKATENG